MSSGARTACSASSTAFFHSGVWDQLPLQEARPDYFGLEQIRITFRALQFTHRFFDLSLLPKCVGQIVMGIRVSGRKFQSQVIVKDRIVELSFLAECVCNAVMALGVIELKSERR